ncbi:hypothetical protein ABPG75_011072 [Micractinium tetrahymenae]
MSAADAGPNEGARAATGSDSPALPAAAVAERLSSLRAMLASLPMAFFCLEVPKKYEKMFDQQMLCMARARETVPLLEKAEAELAAGGVPGLLGLRRSALEQLGEDAVQLALLIDAAVSGEPLKYIMPITSAHCSCGTSADEAPMQSCAKCRIARYCSKQCQRADWPQHRQVCAKLAAEASGAAWAAKEIRKTLQISRAPDDRDYMELFKPGGGGGDGGAGGDAGSKDRGGKGGSEKAGRAS